MKNNDFLLSLQRALLEKVTPNLRGVCIIITNTCFDVTFYYNNTPSEKEKELASIAHTEFISDFPPPDYNTKLHLKIIPESKKIPDVGFCVYHRYESSCEGYF